MNKKQLIFIIFLIFINFIVHFLPPERASFSSDDYVYLAQSRNVEFAQIPKLMFKVPDRPIIFSFFMLQGKLVGQNIAMGFILLVVSSTLLLICLFWLFHLLLENEISAFFAALFYILLPNKLEMYQALIFFNINIVVSIYILSLIAFIFFLKNQRKFLLFFALSGYTIGIFWYEAGFFLPIAVFFYCCFYDRKKIKYSFYYLLPVIFYMLYRFTNSFGFSQLRMSGYNLDLTALPIRPLTDLFNHYFGRYLVRNLIYGIYKFFTIESPWLTLIILINIPALLIIARVMKEDSSMVNRKKVNLYALVLFIVFILPFFLNKNFGIASRYLIMPSIGVSIILSSVFEKLRKKWLYPLLGVICVSLFICQGNSWAQVVSCRINSAIFNIIKENRENIMERKAVILDIKSLADNIPYTLAKNQSNLFETYYGANTFHSEGIKSMVFLATGKKDIGVYLASESPKINTRTVEFAVPKVIKYRMVINNNVIFPKNETFIIDYESISKNKSFKGVAK